MAIFIKNIDTSEKYILLGSGYGMFQSKKPNWFLGNLLADTENGDAKVVCACDKHGKIVWLHADKIQVVEVDGKSPSEYF
ncbi:MAG: hypothetical protein R3E32_23270 [Chitinophagales bacterium]